MFNGPDYDPKIDYTRLKTQHDIIREVMLDGQWRTLTEIEELTEFPQSSISAQLRHLRKPRFGSYIVEKRRRESVTPSTGLYEYRVSSRHSLKVVA